MTLHVTPGELQASADLPTRLPVRTTSTRPANSSGWYKGELHCHTFHSDGDSSPDDVIHAAERLGLDFLAITDHNTFTQQIAMNQIETDLILIPGCEVTTFRGHWNIWGDAGWIDFRVTSEDQMEATIRDAVRQGYLTSCNHPRPDGPPWRFPEVEGYECVEVWNGPWELLNDTCLDFWVTRINQGERLIAVGGSDCHHIEAADANDDQRLGQPSTVIYCEGDPSAARLLHGLRAGHAFITRAPDGPQLYLTSDAAMMGDSVELPASGSLPVNVRVVGGNGLHLELWTTRGMVAQQAISEPDATLTFEVSTDAARYVRAQLKDTESGNVTALTNPIYFGKSP